MIKLKELRNAGIRYDSYSKSLKVSYQGTINPVLIVNAGNWGGPEYSGVRPVKTVLKSQLKTS